jgi:hypothetical protein
MFQGLALLPSPVENTYSVGSARRVLGLTSFYYTQQNGYFHLKMGAEPAPET